MNTINNIRAIVTSAIINRNAIRKGVRVIHYVDIFGIHKFIPTTDALVCDDIADFRLSDIPEEAILHKGQDHMIVAPCRFRTSEGVHAWTMEFKSITKVQQIRRGNPACLPRWALTNI